MFCQWMRETDRLILAVLVVVQLLTNWHGIKYTEADQLRNHSQPTFRSVAYLSVASAKMKIKRSNAQRKAEGCMRWGEGETEWQRRVARNVHRSLFPVLQYTTSQRRDGWTNEPEKINDVNEKKRAKYWRFAVRGRGKMKGRERPGKQNRMNSIKPCSKSSALVQRFVNISRVPISDFSHYIEEDASLSKKVICVEIFSNWKMFRDTYLSKCKGGKIWGLLILDGFVIIKII